MPRRSLIGQALGAAAGALLAARHRLDARGWLEGADAASADVLHETYNALLAFVVPGRDEYSIQQGLTTREPGGVEAGATNALIASNRTANTVTALFQLGNMSNLLAAYEVWLVIRLSCRPR